MEEEKKGYYAIIPATVRYDKRIPANAKLLYGEITALCNEKGCCWATNGYFQKLYGVSVTAIQNWIKALKDCGYIYIEMEQMQYGSLRKIKLGTPTNISCTPHQENLTPPPTNLDPTPKKSLPPPQENLTHNNTVNNTGNNTRNNKNDILPAKIHYSTFVTLTEEEHQKLIDKYGESGTAEIIEILDAYKEANNKKYASDAGAIRSWVADEWQKRKATMPQKKQEEPKKQVEEELDFMDQLEIYKQQKIEEAKRNGTYIDDGSDINF